MEYGRLLRFHKPFHCHSFLSFSVFFQRFFLTVPYFLFSSTIVRDLRSWDIAICHFLHLDIFQRLFLITSVILILICFSSNFPMNGTLINQIGFHATITVFEKGTVGIWIRISWGFKIILRLFCYVNAHTDGHSKVANSFNAVCFCSKLVFNQFSVHFSRFIFTANFSGFICPNIFTVAAKTTMIDFDFNFKHFNPFKHFLT